MQCPECGVEFPGQALLDLHRERIHTAELTPGEIAKRQQRAAAEQQRWAREQNWFQRHLHWTFVLGWLVTFVVAFITGFVMALADSNVSVSAASAAERVVGLVITLPISAWVIVRKGRSLWWLLLAGFLSPLWLGNQNEASGTLASVQPPKDGARREDAAQVKSTSRRGKIPLKWIAASAAMLFLVAGLSASLTYAFARGNKTSMAGSAIHLTGSHVKARQDLIGTTKAKGVFVTVAFTIRNTADFDVKVSDTDFSVLDEKGKSYSISDDGLLAYVRRDESLIWKNKVFPAASEWRGVAIFDLPKAVTPRSLVFGDGLAVSLAHLSRDEVVDRVTVWMGNNRSASWPTVASFFRSLDIFWNTDYLSGSETWDVNIPYWYSSSENTIKWYKHETGTSVEETVRWRVDDRTGAVLLSKDPRGLFSK